MLSRYLLAAAHSLEEALTQNAEVKKVAMLSLNPGFFPFFVTRL